VKLLPDIERSEQRRKNVAAARKKSMRERRSRGINSSNRGTASSRVAFVLIKLAVGGLQKVLGGASIVWVNADADAKYAAANGAIAFPRRVTVQFFRASTPGLNGPVQSKGQQRLVRKRENGRE